ncbi:hypothetical protein Tco_0595224 [Tanacetum coccineum]
MIKKFLSSLSELSVITPQACMEYTPLGVLVRLVARFSALFFTRIFDIIFLEQLNPPEQSWPLASCLQAGSAPTAEITCFKHDSKGKSQSGSKLDWEPGLTSS